MVQRTESSGLILRTAGCCVLFLMSFAGAVRAEESTDPISAAASPADAISPSSELSAADSSTPSNFVGSHIGPMVGARRYRPGVWGLVEMRATNDTDQTVETEAVLRFAGDPTLQFSRRVLVPPHSILRSTCPILVPSFIAPHERAVEFYTQQVDPPPGEAITNRTTQEVKMSAQPLMIDHETPATGMIGDMHIPTPWGDTTRYYVGNLPPPQPPDERVYELILAARRYRDLSHRISVFEPEDLPADPGCLDVLDVLVLSNDQLASDPGGIAAVRAWLLGGGHLWILLTEVQPETAAAILGDSFASELVDRVHLTQLTMKNQRTDLAYDKESDLLTFDAPVDFARVIVRGATVTDTIDDWPAAFWQPFGKGKVFFTTVGPAAWMRHATPRDPPPRQQGEETTYYPREPMKCFSAECFQVRTAAHVENSLLRPILSEQIGYRIVSRSVVASILLGFCSLLLVTGWWMYRAGRPERLLWTVPLLSALFCVVFVSIGIVTKKAVPPTAATIARVTYQPGVNTAHATGLAAVYNQNTSHERMGATRGGIFFPDMTSMTGKRRRMVWTDEGAWHWADLELPAGVRTAPFDFHMPIDRVVDCCAQFGPDGLQGTLLHVPHETLDDALIVPQQGNCIAVQFEAGGVFNATSDDVLPPGTYISSALLSDTQRRRQAVYDQLLRHSRKHDNSLPLQLYAWTGPTDMGFQFPQDQQLGTTLLSIPLRLVKSPAGTRVLIPASFIPYRAVPDADGNPPTSFSNLTRQWVSIRSGATDHLRFQLPESVLPLQIERATLSVNIRAPSRSLNILAFDGERPATVFSRSRPIGSFSAVVDRPELLQLDAAGGLTLAIQVSANEAAPGEAELGEAPWQMEGLQLEVVGTVLP